MHHTMILSYTKECSFVLLVLSYSLSCYPPQLFCGYNVQCGTGEILYYRIVRADQQNKDSTGRIYMYIVWLTTITQQITQLLT